MSNRIDLAGQRFGRLEVIVEWGKDNYGGIMWMCLCDCGEYAVIKGPLLRKGGSKSCGCLQRESKPNYIHGQSNTALYIAWAHMKQRCSNKCNKRQMRFYHGNGITVCDEWLEFKVFFEWARNKWHKGLEIDREDTTKGYCPENCRFVTSKINQQNTRRSKIWFIEGKRFESATDAAKFFNCSTSHIYFICHGRNYYGKYYPPHPNCYTVNKYDNRR